LIGDESFLFSNSGPVKSFKVNEIAEAYEESSPSNFDSKKLETANLIQDEIDALNAKLPDYLKSAEGIKGEINKLLTERKEHEAKIKELDAKINEFKEKFEANKTEINPVVEEIKSKKRELAKILKDLASETGASKLELDL
jgi:peptidoglycan hydrolase CwlO-like protein